MLQAMDPDVAISIVPANEAECDDLNAIFGTRGYPARCRFQRFRTTGDEWWHDPISVEERMFRLRQQTDCGYQGSETTSGLVAFFEDEPVGWCAVDRRSEYIRLGHTPWKERSEDKEGAGVWAVFVVRAGYRGQGFTYPLAAAVHHARERGATALEAYPMIVEEGQ